MPYKVVLVASDPAPSRCFMELAEVLILKKKSKKPVFDVKLIVGDGKPLETSLSDVASSASKADIVVLGMSSPENAEPEIEAGESAEKAKIPFGFYGDIRGCFNRAGPSGQFARLASDTAFYFGVNAEDANSARSIFPSAKLFGYGNPLRQKMGFPKFTRDQVRKKLNVPDKTKLILAPGTKFGAINIIIWMSAIDALTRLQCEGQDFLLVISPHPGDRVFVAVDPETRKELGIYDAFVSLAPVPTRIVTTEILSTSDIVPGADLIVCFDGSDSMEGAYQNIPIVNVGSEVSFRWQELQNGSRLPELVENKASDFVVADANLLAARMQDLLTPEGFAPFRKRQKELYPKPKAPGTALVRMTDTIQDMVQK